MTYNLHQLLKRKASPAARWNKESVTQLFLDVQPTPAPPQELEQKTAKWDLSMNIGTPVANPLVASLAMEDLQKYLDGEVFDPDPTNLTFQPSDHMMTTPGTRSQPAPPKLKQPESWPLLRPGGQEIAPLKAHQPHNLAFQHQQCHTDLVQFPASRRHAYSWAF